MSDLGQSGGRALRVVIRGETYILRQRDIGSEQPRDRELREQSKRELERICRPSAAKALGYSVPPFPFRTLVRSDDE